MSTSIGAPSTLPPLAVSAAAPHQVPFKGTFQGCDTVAPPHHYTRTELAPLVISFTHVLTFPLSPISQWVAATRPPRDDLVVVSSVLGPVVRTNTENHTIRWTVDSRVRKGALRWSAHTFWHRVTMEHMSQRIVRGAHHFPGEVD
jgi:hypothetical protein